MTNKDYYEILGVPKNADGQEIKAAYRKQALKWHPDRNKSKEATNRFKEINQAYEVLSNKEKRAAYDQFGHSAFQQGFSGTSPFGRQTKTYSQGPFSYTYTTYGGQSGGKNENVGFGGFSDPFDIFEQFFGGGSPFGVYQRQQKPLYRIKLDFMEAVKGVEKNITVNGKTKKIKIPAGIDNGMRVRFDNFDLVVSIKPHPKFHREGSDIYLTHTISFPKAAKGGITKVDTIDGPVDLRIKAGTQPGTLIRLSGKGIPYIQRGRRGNQYVQLNVKVPTKLTPKMRELLSQMEKEI